MPSNFDEKNAIVFWGQYPGNFETKFFPLRFEGILYNSVVYTWLGEVDMVDYFHFLWAEMEIIQFIHFYLLF